MTWKANDAVALPIYLATPAGVPLVYADKAAFLAAGLALTWYSGAVALASQPAYTITPIGATGYHAVAFSLPAGVDATILTRPATILSDWDCAVLITPTVDTDALFALYLTSLGTPIASGATSQNFTVTEGDGFETQMQAAAALIVAWGFADLSAVGWSATGAVREVGDGTAGAPLAVLPAQIVDPVNRYVAFGWGTVYPTAMALIAADIITGQKTFNYDVQVKIDIAFAITAAAAGTPGTLTIAGDKRKYFAPNTGATFTVDAGANAGTYTPITVTLVGGNTVISVTPLPSSVVAGNVVVTLRLTVFAGQITVRRQIDRT